MDERQIGRAWGIFADSRVCLRVDEGQIDSMVANNIDHAFVFAKSSSIYGAVQG